MPRTVPTPCTLRPAEHGPVLSLLNDTLLTAQQLATRWGQSIHTLANARRAQKGVPWVVLPTGAIRYRLSDVAHAEVVGLRGPATQQRVDLAISVLTKCTPEERAAVVSQLFPSR